MEDIKLLLVWILAINIIKNYLVISRMSFVSKKIEENLKFKTKFFRNMYVKFSMLELPFKITFKRTILYLLIFSSVLFFISLFTYKNIFSSLIYFCLPFVIFIILLEDSNKKENKKIVDSLNLMVENFIQLLNSNVPFKLCIENIKNLIISKRFLFYYEKFLISYKTFGYNLPLALKVLEKNFDCKELTEFIELLKMYNQEGFVDALGCLSEILDLKREEEITKELRKKKNKMVIGIIILLLNCFVIILYPLINDIQVGIQNMLI